MSRRPGSLESVARSPQDDLFRRHSASVILVTGVVFLLGTAIDFGVLWLLQRGSGLQWRFVASTQTAEGVPRMILGLGLLYLALYLRRSTSMAAYRILGATLLLVGLGSIALGMTIATTYLTMVDSVDPAALLAFRSTTMKSGGLAGLYIVTLVPLGIAGLRIKR